MDNIITLPKWERYCKELCKVNNNYILVNILSFNETNLDKFNFQQYANKTIILLNPDCDFPPPKTPYLNDNHLNMKYKDRIYYKITEFINKYNIKIICFSSSIFHPNVKMIPLGVTWQTSIPSLNIDLNNKNILCYANFGLPTVDCWHGRIRQNVKNIISHLNFITIDNICQDKQERKTKDKYLSYFNKISHSKFSLCPRGCGIDCYRFYDCLFYDCIPIIVKSEDFYKNLSMFPILILNEWEELKNLTETGLNKKYDELMKEKIGYKKHLNMNNNKKHLNINNNYVS